MGKVVILWGLFSFGLVWGNEAAIWEARGYSKVQIYSLDTVDLGISHGQFHKKRFDVTVVLSKDSDWTIPQAMKQLQQTTKIFAQCLLQLRKIKFVLAHLPDRESIADFSLLGIDRKIVAHTPPTARPLIFLMQDTWPYPQWDIDLPNPHISYAFFPRAYTGVEMINTAWISWFINSPHYLRRPGYSTVAHELGHILTNDGHIYEKVPNLMSDHVEWGDEFLNPQQCESILNSPLTY